MSKTIDINLSASLVDTDAKTNMRLLNKLISSPMSSYDQGTLILASGIVDQEIANTGFNKLIIISSEPITIKIGDTTATSIEHTTFFVLDSLDSRSLFLSNDSGSDSTIEFVFTS